MDLSVKIRKPKKFSAVENLQSLSKEELISKVKSLEAHNSQLQNIINKSNGKDVNSLTTNIKSFDFSKCTFRHIALHVFYLGWDYQGFTVQEDTINTVEYNLFRALNKTCLIKDRSSSNYNRCGRTDKGVSSYGQVISIDVRSKLDESNQHDLEKEIDYCKILNRVLPPNIQCVAWASVERDFSARFNCIARTYKYYFPKGKLNIQKMREGAKYLIGSHDFRNFSKMDVGNGVVQFVRNLIDFRIEPLIDEHQDESAEYSFYVARIKGNAFIWHQIRYIMGILFLIGAEREDPTVVKELLDVQSNPRRPDYNMANEVPLNLFFCDYDDIEWQISQESLQGVIEQMQQIWSFTTIKSVMVKDILNHLFERLNKPESPRCLSEYLVGGVKPKKYVPVMKRQKCESLEKKIQHYSKKKRIELVDNSVEDNK